MNTRVLMRSKVALGALCAALGCATSVQAQTAAETEEAATASGEIVVTALKREQKVQDIPASISAVSGDSLAQRGITNIRDLTTVVPNLVWGQFAGTSLITIRGVGSSIDSGVSEPTVATYVDGLALPRGTMSGLNSIDLERVEVLRGPQGTLYGRNATGGAINFVSAKPSRTFEGKVEGSAGSRNAWGVAGYISGPLAEGVYVRISAGRDKQDGYVEVLNTGQRLAGVDDKYGRLAVLLEPTANLSVDLSLRYQKSDAAVAYQQQLAPTPFVSGGLSTNVPNQIYANQPFSSSRETLVAQGVITYEASDNITVRSLTGYIDHKSHDAYDADSTTVPFYYSPDFARPSRSFSQEFTILGDFDRLNFILGGYYFNEKYSADTGATLESGGAAAFGGVPVNSEFLIGLSSRIHNVAAYGDLTYAVSDHFKINLGLRVNHEDNTFGQSSSFFSANPPLVFAPAFNTEFKVKSTKVLPKVAFLVDLSPDVHAYAQWTRGYKSGGGNLGSPGVINPGYNPESLDAYEIGLKSQFFDKRVTANIAAFYYDYTDLQVFTFTPPATSLVENADARIFGIEGDFRFEPTDHLTLKFAATYLDGTFKNFVGTDPFAGQVVNLDGRQLPRAPKFTINAGFEQRFDLGGSLFSELTLTGDVVYNSRTVLRYFDLSPYDHQDAYALVNLSASVTDEGKMTRLSVFVNNLTDQTVRQSTFAQAPSYVGSYGPPRTWGVRISRRF
jgi:iron complex outermembrane receptor protein